MPRRGFATSQQMDLFQLETWTSAPSLTLLRGISPDMSNATSSPALEVGASRSALLAGPTPDLSGPALARASRSRSQARSKGSKIPATSGRNFDGSSQSGRLQSSLESSLRRRLNGSPSCEVIWKPWVTPWAQSLWKPRARERTISGTAIGLWPTTTTPSGGQTVPPGTSLTGVTPDGRKMQVTLQNVILSLWSTLRASDGEKGGPNMSFGAGGLPLPSQVFAIANSSNAPAENGARSLHPEFAGWEMGYPPEWINCAGSETRSTLVRRRSS